MLAHLHFLRRSEHSGIIYWAFLEDLQAFRKLLSLLMQLRANSVAEQADSHLHFTLHFQKSSPGPSCLVLQECLHDRPCQQHLQ